MSDQPANAARGEATLMINGVQLALRPSFAALVAVEEELGSLFAMIERATAGQLKFSEIVALFWHLQRDTKISRATIGDHLATCGLAAVTPIIKQIFQQILAGR
ncbi:MAG: gene transfer agent family protein [Parasphingorhabdus sp.]|nr:gene transfer agent family protein [Parasphingorhabdus sp.]